MTPRSRRWARWLLLALPLGGLVALLARPRPVVVDVGEVARGALEVAVDAQGVTRIEPRFTVAAPVAGRLLRVRLREGDAVAAGEAIAVLVPAPLDPRAADQARGMLRAAVAARDEALARAAEAQAAHGQAERSLRRQEDLAAAGQVAAADLDQARTAERLAREALDATRHRAQAAAADAAVARAALDDALPDDGRVLSLRAPAAGRVLRLFERSEHVVAAGTPLLEIGDPARLEVVVDVLSTDAVRLAAGAAMRVDLGDGTPRQARLRRVEPAAFTKVSPLGVEEQRVRLIGDLVAPAPHAGDGYRVDATVVVWRGEDVLRAPSGAVFRAGDHWSAFALAGGRAVLRRLEIGERNADSVEIRRGLAAGERVVLYPPERLADGDRVRATP